MERSELKGSCRFSPGKVDRHLIFGFQTQYPRSCFPPKRSRSEYIKDAILPLFPLGWIVKSQKPVSFQRIRKLKNVIRVIVWSCRFSNTERSRMVLSYRFTTWKGQLRSHPGISRRRSCARKGQGRYDPVGGCPAPGSTLRWNRMQCCWWSWQYPYTCHKELNTNQEILAWNGFSSQWC